MGKWIHRLETLDKNTGEAVCQHCGPVQAKFLSYYNGWRCPVGTRAHRSRTKSRYKVTLEELITKFGSRCGICDIELTPQQICIDHDHACCPEKDTCGECVRGLLCRKHNLLLGYAEDNVEHLQAAIKYLKRKEPKISLGLLLS